jgi:hypothetical protein
MSLAGASWQEWGGFIPVALMLSVLQKTHDVHPEEREKGIEGSKYIMRSHIESCWRGCLYNE